MWWWEWVYSVESVIFEKWCRVNYEKCLFVCLDMSIKCQDEYGDENERIVLSQRYWKSDAE